MTALTWTCSLHSIGPHQEVFEQHVCAEHPRLLMIVQRPSPDAEFIVTYHVQGIEAQHWSTAAEAIAAMVANP